MNVNTEITNRGKIQHNQLIKVAACCYMMLFSREQLHQHSEMCKRQFYHEILETYYPNSCPTEGTQNIVHCKRCYQKTKDQYICKQCNKTYCLSCNDKVHSKGKFMLHRISQQIILQPKYNINNLVHNLSVCQKHQQPRNILIDTAQIICKICYNENKNHIRKIKDIKQDMKNLDDYKLQFEQFNNHLDDRIKIEEKQWEKAKQSINIAYKQIVEEAQLRHRQVTTIMEKWAESNVNPIKNLKNKIVDTINELNNVQPQSLQTIYNVLMPLKCQTLYQQCIKTNLSEFNNYSYKIGTTHKQITEMINKAIAISRSSTSERNNLEKSRNPSKQNLHADNPKAERISDSRAKYFNSCSKKMVRNNSQSKFKEQREYYNSRTKSTVSGLNNSIIEKGSSKKLNEVVNNIQHETYPERINNRICVIKEDKFSKKGKQNQKVLKLNLRQQYQIPSIIKYHSTLQRSQLKTLQSSIKVRNEQIQKQEINQNKYPKQIIPLKKSIKIDIGQSLCQSIEQYDINNKIYNNKNNIVKSNNKLINKTKKLQYMDLRDKLRKPNLQNRLNRK